MRPVTISAAARASARAAGVFGDVEKRLTRMARRSAPFTSACGNRRFNDFVLHVEDGVVLSVVRMDFEAAAA